jgi:signal peptidase I
MSKRRSSGKRSRPVVGPVGSKSGSGKSKASDKTPSEESGGWHFPSPAAIRETVESVVIAFVLAFLFRTFEAEAFVIPTGSMATTLMGRHKDLRCPICEYPYRVSASEEVDSDTGASNGASEQVAGCTCPMCRFTMDLQALDADGKTYPSYKGDRILVGKFCYDFGDPDRWDVAVFKYPGGAKTNFIKRIVGLPGEVLQIRGGDIFTCPLTEMGQVPLSPQWTIERKPPDKLMAMLHPVFDNDYTPQIVKRGWSPRWRPWLSVGGSTGGAWRSSKDDGRWFEADGSASGEAWIRYEHRVPTFDQWDKMLRDKWVPPAGVPKPALISDFCAYNTGYAPRIPPPYRENAEARWVGDLAVKCTLDVQSDAGQAIFELVEGGRPMQCRIDVATGVATLNIGGVDADGQPAQTIDGQSYEPKAQTAVQGLGQYEIIFANCDDQLRLWVDGSLVPFDTTTCYAPLNNWQPTRADLAPVGIGTRGAALRVESLKVLRDIYYIADMQPPYSATRRISRFGRPLSASEVLSDPDVWKQAFGRKKTARFVLRNDQYLMLGDNSARSKDSRLWEQDGFEYYVSRDLLIGKALYIYWPHSWNRVPGTNIPFPFFPNFARMGLVR